MVSFKVLYLDGSPAKGIKITIDIPGKELVSETDHLGIVSFDIPMQRGRISINDLPLYYGMLEVDAFQIPTLKKN